MKMNMNKVTVIKTCMNCKEDKVLEVKFKDWERFENDGEHVQDCFPYLSANERELLISGICGECFDKMFEEDDDYDEDEGEII